MAQVEYIKELYENEGKSLREIAKIVGKDFRTVQKYAYSEDWTPKVTLKMEAGDYPVLGNYISIIDEWLEQDEKEPRKQRHTVKRIYTRLQKEHNFAGSYSAVKRYVARAKVVKKRGREGFLPIAHPPGEAQVDFGKFKYYGISGEEGKGYGLIVSFPHSNTGWMQVFPSENQECLLTGMKRIFNHIGGVPVRCRFDNMSTAVVEVLKGTERVLTDGFQRFKLHYRFESDFCNPAKGNEKGNVENKVGYTRRNMLVPVPTITDFEAYNAELFKLCDEDHIRDHYISGELICDIWERERQHLLTLPKYEYEVFQYEHHRVSNYGTITINKSKYSVSPKLQGRTVATKIYFNEIEIYYEGNLVKTVVRNYSPNSEDIDWKDYLGTLIRKPGGMEFTKFFNQMPKLWQEYLKNVKGKERKSALMLLSEIVSDGNEALSDEALELASQYGKLDTDNIRQCYLLITEPERYPPPLQLVSSPPMINYHPDLTAYDSLTGGAGR